MGWCKSIPKDMVAKNNFREFGFYAAQPRTYYAWLAKKVKKSDLVDEKEKFFFVSGDAALMFPMLEMAGERFKFIEKVLYTRNVETPINVFKTDKTLQQDIVRLVRNKPKYERLNETDIK